MFHISTVCLSRKKNTVRKNMNFIFPFFFVSLASSKPKVIIFLWMTWESQIWAVSEMTRLKLRTMVGLLCKGRSRARGSVATWCHTGFRSVSQTGPSCWQEDITFDQNSLQKITRECFFTHQHRAVYLEMKQHSLGLHPPLASELRLVSSVQVLNVGRRFTRIFSSSLSVCLVLCGCVCLCVLFCVGVCNCY